MSIAQTQAAHKLEKYSAEISPHKVISLLMEGALERIGQTKSAIQQNNEKDAELLIEKTTAIVNGLRNSLNMDAGGAIAINLEKLYEYMVERLHNLDGPERVASLDEIAELIQEIKAGWDGIQAAQEVAQAS